MYSWISFVLDTHVPQQPTYYTYTIQYLQPYPIAAFEKRHYLCHHHSVDACCPKCEGAMTTSATATKRRRSGFPLGAVALMLTIVYLFSPVPPQVSIDGSIEEKLISHRSGQPWQDDDTLNLTNGIPMVDDDELLEFLLKPSDAGANESFSQRLYGTLTTNPFVVPKTSPAFNSKAVMFHLEEAMLELENQTTLIQDSIPVSIQQGNKTEQIPLATAGNSASIPDEAGGDDNATMPSNSTTRLRRTA